MGTFSCHFITPILSQPKLKHYTKKLPQNYFQTSKTCKTNLETHTQLHFMYNPKFVLLKNATFIFFFSRFLGHC